MRAARQSAPLVAAAGCVAVALLACWVGGADFLLLVDRAVVQPQVLAVIVWSVAVLGGVGLVVLTLLLQGRRSVRRGGHLTVSILGGVVAVTLVGTGIWCSASAAAAVGVDALGPHAYTVLPAADTQGCTLLAHEIGALRTSTGRLYSADAFGFARPVGSWRADEIQLPVRDGEYSVKWRDGVGTLSFQTTRFITPERLEATCRR